MVPELRASAIVGRAAFPPPAARDRRRVLESREGIKIFSLAVV